MVWIICENCSCENRIFHRCSVEGKIRTFSFDLSGQDAGSRVDREIRGSIIPFDGRCALSSVHTIAVTTLLVTVTLCSYGRSIGGSPHSTALINFHQRARRLGGCRPLLTCFHRRTRSLSPRSLLASRFSSSLPSLLRIVHTARTARLEKRFPPPFANKDRPFVSTFVSF